MQSIPRIHPCYPCVLHGLANPLAHRFVVGYDTAIRLVMPKYYGPQPEGSVTAMLLDLDRSVLC